MAKKRKKTLTKKQKIVRRIIWILVILCILIFGFLIWWKFFKKDTAAEEESMYVSGPVYDTAVTTDLESTYAASGKIAAGSQTGSGAAAAGSAASDSSDTTSGTDSTGYPVKEVYVKAGDTVKKGDPLYALDMSDVEDEIALNEKKLALQSQSDAIDNAAAQRALENAQADSAQQYEDATRKLNEAASDANSAIVDSVTGNQDIAKYQQEVADAQAAYDSAKSTYDSLSAQQAQISAQYDTLSGQIELDTAELNAEYSTSESQESQGYKDALKSIQENQVTLQEYANAKTAIDNQVTQAQKEMDDAKTKLDEAQTKLDNATSSVTQTDTSIQTQQRALEDQASEVNKTNRSTVESEQAAKDTIAKNAISQESAALDAQDSIRKAKEKLNGAVIKASMDGTVTAVNVVPGQYAPTDAVVINDLETMKVVIEVEEGHIADIQNGQRVYIKTDSTGNETLDGKVTYTAITPTDTSAASTGSTSQTTAVSTSGTKAAYRVEVTLDSPNDRLRIGMNANVTFVLASSKGCIAVPNNAIQTDEAGNTYVMVVDDTAAVDDTGMTDEAGMEEETAAEERTFKEKVTDFLNRITGKQSDEAAYTPVTYPTRMVEVTTGIASDYYTEITSGDIQEGDMVEEPAGDAYSSADGLLEGMY